MAQFFSIWLKLFFLLTPFFVLTMFLALTQNVDQHERHRMALQLTLAVVIISFVLFTFGNAIFRVFGITLDAFRIGAGSLLFLSAVDLVRGNRQAPPHEDGNIVVVPLAIPITVGPATVGALLVMSAEVTTSMDRLMGYAGLLAAIGTLGVLLYVSAAIQKLIGNTGLSILSKITGLILSALAAQIVFTGIKGFMG